MRKTIKKEAKGKQKPPILGGIFEPGLPKCRFVSNYFFNVFLDAKVVPKWSQREAKMEPQIVQKSIKKRSGNKVPQKCQTVGKLRPSDPRKLSYRLRGVAKITKTGGSEKVAQMEPKGMPKCYPNR